MTDRKPPGVSWETWIERQIREARERGEFDGLPGHGKPIGGLDGNRDELWWIRALVQRENIETLPPTLRLRKEIDAAKEAIALATDEAEVRSIVETINERIREVNRKATEGPPSNLMPMDIDRVVENWRSMPRP